MKTRRRGLRSLPVAGGDGHPAPKSPPVTHRRAWCVLWGGRGAWMPTGATFAPLAKLLGVGLSHGTERFTWNEQPFLVQPSGRVLLIG